MAYSTQVMWITITALAVVAVIFTVGALTGTIFEASLLIVSIWFFVFAQWIHVRYGHEKLNLE